MDKEGDKRSTERRWCIAHDHPEGACGTRMGEPKTCVIRLRRLEQEKTGTMPESPDSMRAKILPILEEFRVPPSQRARAAEKIIKALLPEDKQDPNIKPGP